MLNLELCTTIFPYAKWAVICMTFGRLILMLISLKHLSVCKVYLYYELVNMLVLMCLPQDYSQDHGNMIFMLLGTLHFLLCYFHFWSSFIFTLAV